MQTTNSDGKVLSNSFESAITSSSQFVKPKVVVDFQDSRHLTNVVVSTNSDYSSQFPSSFSSVDGKTVSILSTSGANTFAADGYLALPGVNGNYARVEDSDDLDILGVEGTHFLSVTNAGSSNYATTPANAGLDSVVDDLELVFRVRVNSFTAAVDNALITRGYAGQFFVSIRATNIYLSTTIVISGVNTRTDRALTYSIPLGTTVWLKITRSWGSGDIYAYYAADQPLEPTSWTQIGTLGIPTGTTPSGHLMASNTIPCNIGSGCDADFYRVIVRNGINGITVYDADFTKVAIGATSFNEGSAYNGSVTLNGTVAKIVDRTTFLSLNGVNGSYASIPTSTSLNTNTDIEIVMRLSMNKWTSGTAQTLFSRWNNGGNFGPRIDVDGTTNWVFYWSSDGTTSTGPAFATISTADFPNGSTRWVRFRFALANRQLSVAYASDSENEPVAGAWISSAASSTGAATTLVALGTSPILIGATDLGVQPLNGKIYRAIFRNGFAGTTLADIDFTRQRQFATSFREMTANQAIVSVIGNGARVERGRDFEIVCRVSLDNWAPAAATLVGKWDSASNIRSYKFNRDGASFTLQTSSDGLNVAADLAQISYALVNGNTYWVKVTKNTSTGVATFYVANDQPTEPVGAQWTNIGSAASTYTGSPYVSSSPVELGTVSLGLNFPLAGKMYNAIIRNGIGGTPVLNVNFAAADQFQNFNYYFSKDQVVNGVDYETFAWGVAGALDNYGKVITADGTYSAVPADLSDNYKYGWWSASKSASNGTFATAPSLTLNFTATTVNKIKVVTSSVFGQVKTFTIAVYSISSGLVLSRTYTYDTANYEFEKFINLNTTYTDIHQIVITVTSTKNGFDYARFVAVSPVYQVDISDYVTNVNVNRVRDLHETSLPIAGTSQTSSDITLDNSNKIFSLMNTSSQYGKFLQKDLRVYVYNGWKVSTVSSEFIQTSLTSSLAASGAASMAVSSAGDFPNGDIAVTNLESNYYVVTVDKGTNLEEKILIKKKTSGLQLDIQQRGYAGTEAVAHSINAPVVYDTFEYVKVGTFYVEDIGSTTNGMDVNISLNDRFKFLNDKIIDRGFFRLDSTVPDALRDLMFVGNFPRNKFKSLDRFSDSAGVKGAILQLKCDDESRNNSALFPYQGVRVRLYQLPTGFESNVKDLQIDAYEKQMSDLDKALGLTGSITPSYVTNFSSASLGSLFGSSFTRKGYFNGVMDGYYIPITTNALCEIGVSFNYGGVRLYIDDNLIIDAWNSFTSAQYISGVYNFTAGMAYKIRLEFFHTYGTQFGLYAGFPLVLSTGAARVVIGSSELLTSIVSDDIGSRDASLSVGVAGRNSNRNSGVPSPYVSFRNPSAIDWNTLDSSIVLSNSLSTGAVNSFVRVPYHSSWNASLSTSYPSTDWSIEVLMKSPNGALGGSGEYISNWSNASSTTGFEFFYISSTNHGFRIKSAAGTTITATSSIAMPDVTGWNYIVATYNTFTNTVYYYVNGILNASAVVTASTPVWGTNDLTFGGRGAGFVSGTGVTKPTSSVSANGINLYIDEFNIYARTLSSSDVLGRYKESKIKEVRKFAFLFGFNESVFQTMQNISFADLGRVYIDESENVVYEHFYAYFEPTIDQHANVQQSFADSNFIIDADIKKTLQVNSVVVKVSGTSSSLIETQPIWRAPSPTTLGVLTLMANIDTVANTVVASSFDIVPFPKAGYIVVDKEIMKYSGITQTAFTGVERGVLNSTASAHIAGAKVREAKWFNFEYDKHPVLSVKSPFITGILFEDPDQINVFTWQTSPFKANLVISASDTVDANTVVFAEGTDPLTKKVSYLSIAGIPIQVVENKTQIQEQKAVNSENRRKFGLKEVVIESPFINDVSQAQELASFIISKLSEPIPIMSMNTVLTPKVQVGDRIRISSLDQFDIINSDFWVSSINVSMGSGYSQQVELRKVV